MQIDGLCQIPTHHEYKKQISPQIYIFEIMIDFSVIKHKPRNHKAHLNYHRYEHGFIYINLNPRKTET